jgi:hypothetical protein
MLACNKFTVIFDPSKRTKGKNMDFIEWMKKNNACSGAMQWAISQPEQSVQALWATCQRGDWMLWVHWKIGTAPEVLAPVAYRSATRAMGYASDALDIAGVTHSLRGLVITDKKSAAAAADAAAHYAAAADAAAARYAARYAAADAAAADAAAAERHKSADDCRELLDCPVF